MSNVLNLKVELKLIKVNNVKTTCTSQINRTAATLQVRHLMRMEFGIDRYYPLSFLKLTEYRMSLNGF